MKKNISTLCKILFSLILVASPSFVSSTIVRPRCLSPHIVGMASAAFIMAVDYAVGLSAYIANCAVAESHKTIKKAQGTIAYFAHEPEDLFSDWDNFTELQKKTMRDEMHLASAKAHKAILAERTLLARIVQKAYFWRMVFAVPMGTLIYLSMLYD